MIGTRARAVFGLAALVTAATTCGRESVTALDLQMDPMGSVDQIELQQVWLGTAQVTLDSANMRYPVPAHLLTKKDVLTVWFRDSDDGKIATAVVLGFRCGVPIGAPVTTVGKPLIKGQTVTELVPLIAPTVLTCANTDGGIGGQGGSAGAGAGGSSGGATGGAGGGGRGGGAGTAGTAGAAGTGGTTGVGGGPVGSGGTAGGLGTAGRGGTTGTAGTTGLAGRGGTTGTAGTTGLAGRGGTTGAAGRGGTTGTGGRGGSGCTATGPENCFNNLDDDCDALLDCMDPDCNATAVCVQLDPGLGPLGVVMPGAQAQCPMNYTSATTINSGTPQGGQCSGCNCTPPAVNCVANFYDYASDLLCMTDPINTQRLVGQWSLGNGCNNNAAWQIEPLSGSVLGVGVGPMTPQFPGCNPTGTATAGPPTWANTSKFCATAMAGGGCGAGSACLPAISNMPQRCLLALSGASCPAGTTRTDWYTGSTGNYGCNACSCNTALDASCANVRMYVGNNSPTCAPNAQFAGLAGGEKVCASPGTLKNPSIMFTGTPTPPTCSPQYTTFGSLTPTGPQVVCCRP